MISPKTIITGGHAVESWLLIAAIFTNPNRA
jgi:hypothetical protein